MPLNTNDSSNDGHEDNDVSISDVPVYYLIDNQNDAHADDNLSDDEDNDDTNYELLSQDNDESDGHVTYFQHHMVFNWVEADGDTNDAALDDNMSDDNVCSKSVAEAEEKQHSQHRQIHLDDGKDFPLYENYFNKCLFYCKEQINKIKCLMSGFQLPHDHIPNWAQSVPEDEWRSVLDNKLEEKKCKKSAEK